MSQHLSVLHSFAWMNKYSIVQIYCILFIYSSNDRHLDFFLILAFFVCVSSTAMTFMYKFLFECLFSILLGIHLGENCWTTW